MRIVLTNGCFDILHVGHVKSLDIARSHGDYLIVLLNSDDSIKKLKGPLRPINKQDDRKFLLEHLRCVDKVIIFNGTECSKEISAIHPDVYVKSNEYVNSQNEKEKKALQICGTEIIWIPRDYNYSTSKLTGQSIEVSSLTTITN